jgi:hypothetical protein
MEVQWWEKTVEYRFVLEIAAKRNSVLLTPFDGNHEQAGDAMFADTSNRWLLIEFKREHRHLNTEFSKFNNYRAASLVLGSRDDHHHLVIKRIIGET